MKQDINRQQTKLLALILAVVLFFLPLTTFAFTSFNNLSKKLTEEDISQIQEFDKYLKLAKEGNFSAQYMLIDKLYTIKKLRPVTIELMGFMLSVYGVQSKIYAQRKFGLDNIYAKLALEYLSGTYVKRNIKFAFDLLVNINNTAIISIFASSGLESALNDFYLLPELDFINHVWSFNTDKEITMDELIRQYEDYYSITPQELEEDEEDNSPDESVFTACEANNQYTRNQEFNNKFNQVQNKLLEIAQPNEKEISTAKAAVKNLINVKYQNKIVSFSFKDISIPFILEILMYNLNNESTAPLQIKINPELSKSQMLIRMQHMESYVIYQRLLQAFDLEVLCHKNWIFFKHKHAVKNAYRKIFIPQLITSIDKKAKKQTQIMWGKDISYLGSVIDNSPSGQGVLQFNSDEFTLKGNFEHWMLSGVGEEYTKGKDYAYYGEYKNGLFNGHGKLIDKSFDVYDYIHKKGNLNSLLEGEFVDGEYQQKPKEDYYFILNTDKIIKSNLGKTNLDYNSLDNLVRYHGTLVNDVPQGNGHCYLKNSDYPCSFYKGYIFGLGDFSLLPKNIKLPKQVPLNRKMTLGDVNKILEKLPKKDKK